MPEAAGPLGILGGTFDPVHLAHLHLARAALRQLQLEAVTWIPAGQPYHRGAPAVPAADRLAMVRLATAGEARFSVDDSEALSDEPSYTVPTLERLRRMHGTARPLVLLMGADAFRNLPSWRRWEEIFGLAHIAVAARPGAALTADSMDERLAAHYRTRCGDDAAIFVRAAAGAIAVFTIDPVDPPDLSATAIRERLRHGEPLSADLLPAGVLDYIRRHHLYST